MRLCSCFESSEWASRRAFTTQRTLPCGKLGSSSLSRTSISSLRQIRRRTSHSARKLSASALDHEAPWVEDLTTPKLPTDPFSAAADALERVVVSWLAQSDWDCGSCRMDTASLHAELCGTTTVKATKPPVIDLSVSEGLRSKRPSADFRRGRVLPAGG